MDSEQRHEQILKRAMDDRERHPWHYYRFEHDAMKKMLDQLSARAEAAEAEVVALRQRIAAMEKAVRNIRLSAAAARTFGHSGAVALDKQIERKNARLDSILRFCADIGEVGSVLREASGGDDRRAE